MRIPGSIVALVTCLLLVVLLSSVASACPTCKDGMAQDKNQANYARGYGMSIVFMMSMPFLILCGIGGYFFYLVRKAQAEQAANQPMVEMTNAISH